ncbi:hypothetical protein DYU05_05825 [Mucilaginibacter terrenus]|uniref:Uncharacterized protein n=1 Tax=Mucilaginibacter terrenus TaxID=2482727 RepID=A0A3E2NW90_9SPHI|nr:hypothetical protein [Mucilaginibacter terrenus]RFZ85120.1 hypothetical protein DYU05_05825 [Mucilaginibacter terrenus]
MWFDVFSLTLLVFIALTAIIMAYNIIAGSDEEDVDLFARFRMHTAGMGYFGGSLFVAAAFSLFPETFLIGLLMLALLVAWIAYMRFFAKAIPGAVRMISYLLLIILMAYCKFPVFLSRICLDNCAPTNTPAKPVAVCSGTARP